MYIGNIVFVSTKLSTISNFPPEKDNFIFIIKANNTEYREIYLNFSLNRTNL